MADQGQGNEGTPGDAIQWAEFPKGDHSKQWISKVYDATGKIVDGSPPILFQFTLPVAFFVYASLQPWIAMRPKEKDGKSVGARELIDRLIEEGDTEERYYRDPEDVHILKTPLRAVSYFSWEREKRVFLARRVYPTRCDFLSYSQVETQWGSLGRLLQEVKKTREDHGRRKPRYYNDIRSDVAFLPFLREALRLRYRSVIAVPVWERTEGDAEDGLLGGVLLHLRDANVQLDQWDRMQASWIEFARYLGEVAAKHQRCIEGPPSPEEDEVLFDHVCSNILMNDKNLVVHVRVQLAGVVPTGLSVVEKASDVLVRQFNGADCCSLVRSGPTKDGDDVYYIDMVVGMGITAKRRPRKEIDTLEERVLLAIRRAIGELNRGSHLTYRVHCAGARYKYEVTAGRTRPQVSVCNQAVSNRSNDRAGDRGGAREPA